MSFPRITRKIEKDRETIKTQFLTENLELILDRDKCVGCGTCARVCPKEAITRGPIGATSRFPTSEDIVPQVYDPNACVYCGTCVVMCPASALQLKKNGEVINLADIPIVEKHALPKIDFEAKKVKSNAGKERVMKQYATGELSIEDDECAKGCSTCAEVCPTGAIKIAAKPEHGWEQSKNVEVADEDKCVFCGACDNACPTGAIHLKITDVKVSGDYNEIFWDKVLANLKKLKWSKAKEE